MRNFISILVILGMLVACSTNSSEKKDNKQAANPIQTDTLLQQVKSKALEVVKTGFNAGDGYGEVWIRDYNTFITLSAQVHPAQTLKENLRVFFRLQGKDGNIVDGFIPQQKARQTKNSYAYIFTELEPQYAGHKNTVETDQESSLVQAVYKYSQATSDTAFLQEKIGGISVAERLEQSMDFLLKHRYNEKYGLIWGATTADWGDVQPEHDWGVYLTEDTHYAIDIYDNAMFLIALDRLMSLLPAIKTKWQPVRDRVATNAMKHLWDGNNQKFMPHIYLNGSPFPADFDENQIFYHGGTAVAIEADLLSKEQINISLQKMIENVKQAGAATIGLTLYPTYPEGSFKNKGMYPYGYQNGGDWTWFGGRMIQQLIRHGFKKEAYEQLKPMLQRVVDNNGFYEWYTVDNKPKGSGTFRGEAGVLYEAITMLENNAAIGN
ncbi:amylo-alpha-1,6-glucosidase [Rhodocytophaga aerolata]|uniref:Amylo-alpha-1,6-glucosidase n=1 Tax=Rhodocytophaga aerolata TaxID=455078 RepID=A0ABT8RH13_9BACT|nr:amylo-alpha-1,6-glucosidase [Rhodocytophaga aerolata]MDO1451397.1 amylo-alpha-1,6-glucosidase [Rhodocytophaga aerolata]